MERKIALVTGANSGMGLAAAKALAAKGFFVVMLCRNQERGEEALGTVRARGDAALMLCDLGDLADIRRFCAGFCETYARLDVLICNAGVLNVKRRETKDGLESHFGICHIGHFLLTQGLLTRLAAGSRIVVVGSVAHKIGRIDFDDLDMKKGYSVAKAYARAKLCNMLFTKEASRRLAGTGITINCAHPGAVLTNIGAFKRKNSTDVGLVRKIAGFLTAFFVKTPEQGAETAVYLATSDECAGISGEYFADCKIVKHSRRADDLESARKLWRISEEIMDKTP